MLLYVLVFIGKTFYNCHTDCMIVESSGMHVSNKADNAITQFTGKWA